ncbi:MAG: hypothetical protein LIO91_01475 [Bacteroidales bacterium]|nr:hypothetical protein [Bacteroidales bacterium]
MPTSAAPRHRVDYDTRNNSFYVFIRNNGQGYWWSESGHVLYEFRELVDSLY